MVSMYFTKSLQVYPRKIKLIYIQIKIYFFLKIGCTGGSKIYVVHVGIRGIAKLSSCNPYTGRLIQLVYIKGRFMVRIIKPG